MKPTRKRRLSPKARQTLELLAGSPQGMNEALLIYGHGLSRQMLASLVSAGLARREVVVVSDRSVEVARLSITPEGRQAITAEG